MEEQANILEFKKVSAKEYPGLRPKDRYADIKISLQNISPDPVRISGYDYSGVRMAKTLFSAKTLSILSTFSFVGETITAFIPKNEPLLHETPERSVVHIPVSGGTVQSTMPHKVLDSQETMIIEIPDVLCTPGFGVLKFCAHEYKLEERTPKHIERYPICAYPVREHVTRAFDGTWHINHE